MGDQDLANLAFLDVAASELLPGASSAESDESLLEEVLDGGSHVANEELAGHLSCHHSAAHAFNLPPHKLPSLWPQVLSIKRH